MIEYVGEGIVVGSNPLQMRGGFQVVFHTLQKILNGCPYLQHDRGVDTIPLPQIPAFETTTPKGAAF